MLCGYDLGFTVGVMMRHSCVVCDHFPEARCDESGCDLAGPGRPGKADECRLCWLRLGGLEGKLPLRATGPPKKAPCRHLGPDLKELVLCPTCAGAVKLKTFGCEIHGRCTIAKQAPGVQCCAVCPDYSPVNSPTGGSMKWSYGVTTVPSRRKWSLPQTLHSLALGGFDKPRLFVDGDRDGTSWQKEFGLEVTARGGESSKVVAHWVLSMLELYYREPHADRYAVFQDDLLCYLNLRAYLERSPYPEKGYLNLLTFPQNQRIAPDKVGWFEGVILNDGKDPSRYQKGLGAVALVFDNLALRTLFTSTPTLFDKPKHPSYGKTKMDGGIVTAMNLAGWREYVHNPSLVQHTGVISSREENTGRYPDAPSFLGEWYNAMNLLPKV